MTPTVTVTITPLDQLDERDMLTNWSPENELIRTRRYGMIPYLRWCRLEVERFRPMYPGAFVAYYEGHCCVMKGVGK